MTRSQIIALEAKIAFARSLWTCEHCMKINRDKIDPCIFCGKPKPKN